MKLEVNESGLTVDWLYSTFLVEVWKIDPTFDRKSKLLPMPFSEFVDSNHELDFVCLSTLFENTILDFLLTQRDNFIDDIPDQTIMVPFLKPKKTYTHTGKRTDDPYEMSSYKIL